MPQPVLDNAALVAEAAERLRGASPQEVLLWGLTTFPRNRVSICTSLQDEGMAVLDMAVRIDWAVNVFTIDTGRLPAATYDLMDEINDRFGVKIEILYPDATEVSELVSEHGINLMYKSTELRLGCCEVRKVLPLNRRLKTLDAWITGLRRDQNASRADVEVVELDEQHGGIVKINPLANWTHEQVLEHIEKYNVPRNSLYRKGYTSIGCDPCTRAIEPGEELRAGRWWWEQGDTECGIHYETVVDADGNSKVLTRADSAPAAEASDT
ncbi:MAG: phosphoadenylyl-sulfate reductase [Candidatus Dormibacteraeota bacterium]|nr:phosphoadenylyl-sulfate reductase [Candidatus Dormibacteraeota bacterium]